MSPSIPIQSTQPSPWEFSQAASLEGLVAYAPGSVVSRTLVKQPGGTVTLFAFDAGQELSEHSAPFDALVQVIDGEAVLTIGGTPVQVSTGQAALMPANVPHAVRAPRRMKMLLTMVKHSA